jgi:hypothetical protein
VRGGPLRCTSARWHRGVPVRIMCEAQRRPLGAFLRQASSHGRNGDEEGFRQDRQAPHRTPLDDSPPRTSSGRKTAWGRISRSTASSAPLAPLAPPDTLAPRTFSLILLISCWALATASWSQRGSSHSLTSCWICCFICSLRAFMSERSGVSGFEQRHKIVFRSPGAAPPDPKSDDMVWVWYT